ncbi:E3 ubiquitin-protein ligase TRIM45 isoform X2 [Cavia porcellus]|uniref:E3 ubiquitin-protein ligase TRIM45 isoform X2 n=1 Tax=Cavia porcellus TaxID=10141 RepID=UPI002FE34D6A
MCEWLWNFPILLGSNGVTPKGGAASGENLPSRTVIGLSGAEPAGIVCTSCLEKLEPFSVVDLRGADSDTSSEGSVFQEHKPQNLQRQIGILCPGSPFTVTVRRKHRPHPGVFHCCTFCSSGGRKTARCACGGTMPGGYLGCGHGHKGHPGRPHWSCCGKFTEKSECTCTSGQNTPRSLLRTVAL